ncbi:MAG: hypothetical protein IJN79_08500 [Clostridia bacterium]|nr:hypothetical protein [Clostridia bacterium]
MSIRFHVPKKIAVRQLKKLLKKIHVQFKADGTEFVSGKGKRKTQIQRLSKSPWNSALCKIEQSRGAQTQKIQNGYQRLENIKGAAPHGSLSHFETAP